MTNSDIQALVTFFLLLIPFGLIWFKAFKHYKSRIKTLLSKWILTLISLLGLSAYYYLTFWLGQAIDGRIGDSMAMASFAVIVFSIFPSIIIAIVTLILTILHLYKKQQTLN
jgi:hypothetical protein